MCLYRSFGVGNRNLVCQTKHFHSLPSFSSSFMIVSMNFYLNFPCAVDTVLVAASVTLHARSVDSAFPITAVPAPGILDTLGIIVPRRSLLPGVGAEPVTDDGGTCLPPALW